MRQITGLFCLMLFFMLGRAAAQPLKVRYSIYAAVDDEDSAHTITAYEKVYLQNNTDQPLSTVDVSLDANAYVGDSSGLSESLLKKGDLRFYFAGPDERGGYGSIQYTIGEQKLVSEPLNAYGERTRIHLPKPLAAGDSTQMDIRFLLKIPRNFIGFGYEGDHLILRHWYPEIASAADNSADFEVQLLAPEDDLVLANAPATSKVPLGEEMPGKISYHYQLLNAAEFQVLLKKYNNDGQGHALPEGLFRERTADVIDKGYFEAFSEGGYTNDSLDAAALFARLLPGPLKNKRPLDPVRTLKQVRLATDGLNGKAPSLSVKPAFLMNLRETDKYHYLSALPVLGYNHYDQVMAGVMMHNYQLPSSPFEFLLAPMIGTKSSTLTGIGRLAFNLRRPGSWWQISLDASSYAMGDYDGFQDEAGNEIPAGFKQLWRVVPAVHYTAYPDVDNKKKNWGLDLRSIWMRRKDWHITGESFAMDYKSQVIGELRAHLEDSRKLYPYRLEMKLDMTGDFLRLGATAKYFLNYNAKDQGLRIRAYAGKFFYLKQEDGLSAFNFGNAYLSLSGVDGIHDFTFDHYFIGRSEQEGWLGQQLAEEGGFFKVSTPLLNEPVGISDNWLAALNLVSDIPDGINPFALLPFKLPVRAFVDLGTYSGAWEENPVTGRFLYDAGLQVSVFRDALTVYFPLLYSKVYRDNYKSMSDNQGSFSHRIRFSIQLGKLKPKVLDKILPF